jgi:hypothetical protein
MLKNLKSPETRLVLLSDMSGLTFRLRALLFDPA